MTLSCEIIKRYQNSTLEDLNEYFKIACSEGDIDSVRYLLTSPDLPEHADVHDAYDSGIRWACFHGHLEVVRYLLTSSELTDHADIHANDDQPLKYACSQNHRHIVSYLLTSPELTDHADVHADADASLLWACERGHTDIVHYLLTSPDLKNHTYPHANRAEMLQSAHEYGHLELARYLLTSSNVTDHADNEECFQLACQNGYFDIAHSLLSFHGKKSLDFHNKNECLKWALREKHHDMIKFTVTSLYEHDISAYLDHIGLVKDYCDENGIDYNVWLQDVSITYFDTHPIIL